MASSSHSSRAILNLNSGSDFIIPSFAHLDRPLFYWTVSGNSRDLFTNIFAVSDKHQNGQERHGRHFHFVESAKEHGQRTESKGGHPTESEVAQDGEDREKDGHQTQHNERVVGQQGPQGNGDALAAVKA